MLKRKLLVCMVFGMTLILSSCGEKPNGVCDACGKEANVKTYKITSPYNEIMYMSLCGNCAKDYSLSVPLLKGRIEEVSSVESQANKASQSNPTATPVPEGYTLAPGTTPAASLADIDPSAYNRLLEQLENQKPEGAPWPSHKSEGWDVIDITAYQLENQTALTMTRADVMAGGILIINSKHLRPSDFSDSGIKSISNYLGKSLQFDVIDDTISMFPNAIEALFEATNAAKAEGINDYVVSEGYINDDYLDFGTGLSFRLTEHQKGDIEFSKTEQGRWMNENCWKYGIIFRYPLDGWPLETSKDKSSKTGIAIHNNQYRFVGKGNAAVMHYFDFCLEEYIEYLQAHPHIAVFENGVLKYEVYRQYVGDANSFDVVLTRNAMSYTSS